MQIPHGAIHSFITGVENNVILRHAGLEKKRRVYKYLLSIVLILKHTVDMAQK